MMNERQRQGMLEADTSQMDFSQPGHPNVVLTNGLLKMLIKDVLHTFHIYIIHYVVPHNGPLIYKAYIILTLNKTMM